MEKKERKIYQVKRLLHIEHLNTSKQGDVRIKINIWYAFHIPTKPN